MLRAELKYAKCPRTFDEYCRKHSNSGGTCSWGHMQSVAPSRAKRALCKLKKGHLTNKYVKRLGHVPFCTLPGSYVHGCIHSPVCVQ